jgi:hypothetical protein
MKKLLPFLLILCPLLLGQQAPPSTYVPQLISFPGAPTGVCDIYQIALNNSNGQYYSCIPGTRAWAVIAGAPQMTWTGFLAAPTSVQTFSNFISTSQITVIRIQAVVGTAAVGCSTFPVWSVYDIGASSIVTSLTDGTALVFDTGAISVTNPGGALHSLGLRVTTAAVGCGTPPANLNLTVTYTMP